MKVLFIIVAVFAAWVVGLSVWNAIVTFDSIPTGPVTCTTVVEEDGSVHPVYTDYDAKRCLEQRGINPRGWFAQP